MRAISRSISGVPPWTSRRPRTPSAPARPAFVNVAQEGHVEELGVEVAARIQVVEPSYHHDVLGSRSAVPISSEYDDHQVDVRVGPARPRATEPPKRPQHRGVGAKLAHRLGERRGVMGTQLRYGHSAIVPGRCAREKPLPPDIEVRKLPLQDECLRAG